jgi:hypothetical protein
MHGSLSSRATRTAMRPGSSLPARAAALAAPLGPQQRVHSLKCLIVISLLCLKCTALIAFNTRTLWRHRERASFQWSTSHLGEQQRVEVVAQPVHKVLLTTKHG